MATTTNYGWDTPDDTDLVKDGAAAIRTLGSSIDTTTKALNPSTTLGDIEYRSSTANTNTRLGIGATGTILTVAGGVPTWAAAASTGKSFTLLNTGGTALTGATSVTVNGISGKDTIYVIVVDASAANAEAQIQLRLNEDSGTNYNYAGQQLTATATYSTSAFSGTNAIGATQMPIAKISGATTSIVHGGFMVQGANSTGIKTVDVTGAGEPTGNNQNTIINFKGVYLGTSTISSITIRSNSGNLDGGTVYVYASA